MNKKKIIEMCKKLHAVAFQVTGNENEKLTARTHLEKLMESHELSLSDIDPESVELVKFRYSTKSERDILTAIYSKVTRRRLFRQITKNRLLFFTCTAAQEIEIGRLFDIYKKHFHAELEKFTTAFIHQNAITNFDTFIDEDEAEEIEPTKKERQHDALDIEQILAMAAGMSECSISPEIEHDV